MPDREVTAMLDCEDGDKQGNSNCKHCQAGGDTDQQQRYWDIPLDPDLLETIVKIYPDWFKDCNMNLTTDGRDTNNPMCLLSSSSSSSSDSKGSAKQKNGEYLQHTIDKNKESLKVKLMLRRPLNQLVDQGILPSLKSPPAFHEQRQKLERAKMGDILKHKLQKRPDRQELIQQHVLEDSCVDSSLQEKQKQLKKARLADTLNGMISQRPGPIDLVKGNILHADELLAQAVRENVQPFKITCDTPSPTVRTTLEDDSGSDGAFSPSPPYEFSEHSQSSLHSLEASEPSPNPNQGSPCSGGTSFSMSPPSSVSSPLSGLPSVVSPQSGQEQITEFLVMHRMHQHQQQHNGALKDTSTTTPNKNRKKSKPKAQPKTKPMKFHEYKGPPNAQKPATTTTSSSLTDCHFELLLKQQQLLIQLQLECEQQTHAQVNSRQVNSVQRPSGDQPVQTIIQQKANTTNQTQPQPQQPQQQQLFESPNSPQKILSNFEDLKVSDLKAELKKKGLPVSGSKPQLIQRLRSHVPQSSSSMSLAATSPSAPLSTTPTLSNSPHAISVDNIFLDGLHTIPTDVAAAGSVNTLELSADTIKSILNTMVPNSLPAAMSMDVDSATSLEKDETISDSSSASLSNEDIVQLQQLWIEELQREVDRSRKQLRECQLPGVTSPMVVNPKPPAQTLPQKTVTSTSSSFKSDPPSTAESKVAQRQIIHQFLQQKIQQQELQKAQRQQDLGSINTSTSTSPSTNANSTLTALLKSSPLNASSLEIDLSSMAKVSLDMGAVAKTVSAFPGSVMSTQVQDSKMDALSDSDFGGVTAMDGATNEFPGVIPIYICHPNSDNPLPHKANDLPPPNAISSRSSSLPSFSALRPSKPSPTRSNTDPQFQITRPPPNYSEATRQLKVKQQHHLMSDGNPRQSKKHKSSIKSQAVDDVLEILINNGELSPSAAQDPITPVTPTSSNTGDQNTLHIFPSSTPGEPFFSKPLTTTSLLKTTVAPASNPKEIATNNSDLHLTSLQSVLDLTPPPSTGFADTGCAPSNSMDFDFRLDMPDIDALELDGLDGGHQVPSSLDPSLSISMAAEPKTSLEFVMSKSAELANHLMRTTEMTELQERVTDRGMDDNEIIEWLEDFEETSGQSSTTNNFQHSTSYGITNDNDPLFSNGHDTLDFFSGDDMDFKPQHDFNFLPWGENTT